MSTAHILFPLGVRLSTWAGVALLISFAVVRRDKRFLIAGLVWLTGFEAVYDISSFVATPSHWSMNALFFVASVFTLFWFRHAVRPDWRLMGVVAAIWVVWIATGFHVNGHAMLGFDPVAEALNEAAKTLWAIAYLVPLLSATSAGAMAAARGVVEREEHTTTPKGRESRSPDVVIALPGQSGSS